MSKVKGTCGTFRKHIEDLTPALPKGKQAKKAERKRRKQMSKGSEMSSEELQQRSNHRTRVVSSGSKRQLRGQQRHVAIEEYR